MQLIRIMSVFLVLAVVALGGGRTAVGARHRQPLCVRYRCSTLAATAQIRVYQARNRHPAVEELFLSSFVRWLPTGRVTPLGDYSETTEIVKLKLLALAGRFVADATESCGRQGCASSVSRLNAQTGHRENATTSTTASELDNPNHKCDGAPNAFGALGVTDLAVTRRGTVAWIIGGSYDDRNQIDLRSRTVCDLPPASSRPVVVNSDPAIEPKSLAAIAGHLYWTEHGAARAAAIQ